MRQAELIVLALALLLPVQFHAAENRGKAKGRTWAADNGNGTFSNPLFYDEFSDPDMIRVGDDYYLTGTTMHAMPGLPILHSRDLVNWRFVAYAFNRLDLGPDFRLEDGKEIYGQGIWAPSFRYHKGTFYIFANVNRFGLQVFRATDVRGPWKHNRIDPGLHDLSVLFDDDGKIYAVYGVRTIRIVEMKSDLTGLVPGTDRVLIGPELGLGEVSHFYKLNGKYYIVSAIPGGHVPMKCARADSLAGPWEVETISENESLGIGQSYRLKDPRKRVPPFEFSPPNLEERRSLTLHQGGIVDTASGEWWGYSMQDHNSVGRLTALSPVTWVDGWPYFGLPGNLTRTPKTWVKPRTAHSDPVSSPYERSDDFSGSGLKPVWQWSHVPDDTKWSLSERPGFLRLRSLPAKEFWWAKNSLTQRAIGPESIATAALDVSGMQKGDVAGLALLNLPYSWLGVKREQAGLTVEFFDHNTGNTIRQTAPETRIQLRAHCNFDKDVAQYSYSTDGKDFKTIGGEIQLPFQLKTFQGVRYTLFHYNDAGAAGGYVDFDTFTVDEPRPRGLTQPIPANRWVTFWDLASGQALSAGSSAEVRTTDVAGQAAAFRVEDRGTGRVALRTKDGRYLSVVKSGEAGEVRLVSGKPGNAETFQWVDLQRGDTLLLSLATNRYLVVPPAPGALAANHAGPSPDRKDGSCFRWQVAK